MIKKFVKYRDKKFVKLCFNMLNNVTIQCEYMLSTVILINMIYARDYQFYKQTRFKTLNILSHVVSLLRLKSRLINLI